MEAKLPAERTDAIERTEWLEPIDRIESFEPMESREFSDPMDNREAPMGPFLSIQIPPPSMPGGRVCGPEVS